MLRSIIPSAVALLVISDMAVARCSPPTAPFCTSRFGSFDDKYEFDRCKREMSDYRDEVEAYIQCVNKERNRTIEEYNDAVESFNRRARG